MFHGLLRDLMVAARRLVATPTFTVFAVLSLGAGLGVTTAAYSVVHALLLQDVGIAEPDRVMFVMTPQGGRLTTDRLSPADVEELTAAQRQFSDVAESLDIRPALVSPATTEVVPGEAVDGAYFATLGVTVVMGRGIEQSDDEQARPVAVLSHRVWRTRFASDPAIVGKTVRMWRQPFEVIGVAPEPFGGSMGWFQRTGVWIPLGAVASIPGEQAPGGPAANRDRRQLKVLGRLRRGATALGASSELATIAARLDAVSPRRTPFTPPGERRGWAAQSVADVRASSDYARRFGFVIVGLIALVLAVACTNLANLVLARSAARHREVAIRRSLGASRWRLVREQVAESGLIAIAGGGAGWLVFAAIRAGMATDLPLGTTDIVWIQPTLNGAALAAAGTGLLLSLLVFGLEPALRLTRSGDLRAELAIGSSGAAVAPAFRQRMLLRWQVAVSAGFFIIATLCVRQTVEQSRHDTGVDVDHLAVVVVEPDGADWSAERLRRLVATVTDEALGDAAVNSVAASTCLPFGVFGTVATLSLPDTPLERGSQQQTATAVTATASIFRTLGVPVLRGRGFDDSEPSDPPRSAVVSERTARTLFGTTEAVGSRLVVTNWRRHGVPATVTVVGIARDTDVGGFAVRDKNLIYLPFSARPDFFVTFTGRSATGPSTVVRVLRQAVRHADPDLPIHVAGTGPAVLGRGIVVVRAAGLLAMSLGLLTLLLAMVGLYGVQSHIVSRRTREIGIRMSLGATATAIRAMVLRDGYRPVVEGLGIGLFIGFAGRAIIRSYLVARIDIVDPWVLALVPIPLVLAAFCACYLPARRAARVDPNVALRSE